MMLRVEDLTFSYPKTEKPLFRHVNLALERGEILTILGPNGAGKSTLLNCIANVLKPSEGEIFLNDVSVQKLGQRRAAQLMGYVPQNHVSAYDYSVRDFIVMGRAPYLGMFQKPGEADYEIVDQVMEELGISGLAEKPYTQISGGERQQALIARAIVQQPEIILFDEPTNHLDFGNQLRMIQKIRNLADRGFAVIMTTHMPDHAMILGGKAAILNRQGELLTGKAEEILTEQNLREIYQVELRMVYVKEVDRKVCVFQKLNS